MSDACEIPLHHATPEEIQHILKNSKTIAIVGLSDKPDRPSYRVAQYLQEHGYKIIPVNPMIQEVLGEKAYPDLLHIHQPVDIVDIFRNPEAVPGIVAEAIEIGAKAIWMQEHIVNNAAAEKALSHKIQVVMNRCIMKEHKAMTI
jgi:predicted CoA-binding protein